MNDASTQSNPNILASRHSSTVAPLSARPDLAAKSVLLAALAAATLTIAFAATALAPPGVEAEAADPPQPSEPKCDAAVTEAEFRAWGRRLIQRRAFGFVPGSA